MYSRKVIDHYENPRNVGTLDKNDNSVGTGLVGAPACGDVMRLQIKITENGVIEDAKFKTYGCFVSNTPINTPTKGKKVSSLLVGDKVLAWNGENIVPNEIEEIISCSVPIDDLLVVTFQRESHRKNMKPNTFKLIVTSEHVFWNANNKPILAKDLVEGQELYEITEYELRKLTNNRHRQEIKDLNSIKMKELNKNLDHSSLPQNKKGYVCKNPEKASKLKSKASIRNWESEEYRNNWSKGMANIDHLLPTKLEKEFIDLFKKNNMGVKFSAGKIWVQSSTGPVSPDFIVPGKKKCIEVYTKKMPNHMQDRSDGSDYEEKRREQLLTAGYETLFLSIEDIHNAIPKANNFIHNGMKIVSINKIKHGNELRGSERDNKNVIVYDLKLKEGAHVYFANRVGSHNCGSAIASSSLVTEWIKGRTIEQALNIKNTDIVEHLSLPPVKIHCSVLAEDAIRAAIEDYKNKLNNKIN